MKILRTIALFMLLIGVAVAPWAATFDPAGVPTPLPITRGGTNATSFTGSRCIETNAGGTAFVVAAAACGSGGGGAPTDAGYWVDTANATLTAERDLGALSTGLVLNTVTVGVGVPSAYAGTSCTNQVLISLNASGAGTCNSALLASAYHANEGTTTTLLHGNAVGNPSWAAVVSADLSITTTTCTNQFVTALSAGAVGTCTTATLAGAQFANQGTTTTILHGNAAGNPSWAEVALTTDTSGSYVASVATTSPITGGAVGSEGATLTLACATCALTTTTLTIAGTANEITSSAGAQDLSANRTWTLSIPTVLDLSTKVLSGASPMVFEGLTADAFETTVAVTDPTAARTFTIPNANSVAAQALTCGGTDKFSAMSAAGVFTCTADSGGNHNILSATHSDSLAASVVRGDLIVGNVTPAWARLAIGANATFLRSNGTDAAWTAIVDGDVPDTITASNYLLLAGGTMTGQIVLDNLAVEFEESDTNPSCAAGNYNIYADLSEVKFKKCTNGAVTDLDTGGAGDTQIFTANGTWSKLSGVRSVYVIVCGGGGGGGGGRGDASGTVRQGGGGGGGGACAHKIFDAADLGATETVTVGAGGTAGTGGTSANGTAGGVGGNTTFGARLTGYGGGGGTLGSNATDRSGGSGGGTGAAGLVGTTVSRGGGGPANPDTTNLPGSGGAGGGSGVNGTGRGAEYGGGGGGGVASTGAAGKAGGGSIYGGAGGGSGGGVTSGNVGGPGDAGGSRTWETGGGGGGGAGGAIAGNGTAGAAGSSVAGGTGGGGGGGDTDSTGGTGGAGGVSGGGGGGGGAGTSTGGAGAAGGDGKGWVISW